MTAGGPEVMTAGGPEVTTKFDDFWWSYSFGWAGCVGRLVGLLEPLNSTKELGSAFESDMFWRASE